jgi:hypothetical protein
MGNKPQSSYTSTVCELVMIMRITLDEVTVSLLHCHMHGHRAVEYAGIQISLGLTVAKAASYISRLTGSNNTVEFTISITALDS